MYSVHQRPKLTGHLNNKRQLRQLQLPLKGARHPRTLTLDTCAMSDNNLRDWWTEFDRKANVSAKLKDWTSDIDSQFGITRRFKIFLQDAPILWRRTRAFLDTPVGGAVGIALLIFSVYSGLVGFLFRIFNILFLLALVLPILLAPYISKKMEELQVEYAKQQREQQLRQQFGPFYDMFKGGGAAAGGRQQQKSGGRGVGRKKDGDDVIDVSYETLDD